MAEQKRLKLFLKVKESTLKTFEQKASSYLEKSSDPSRTPAYRDLMLKRHNLYKEMAEDYRKAILELKEDLKDTK